MYRHKPSHFKARRWMCVCVCYFLRFLLFCKHPSMQIPGTKTAAALSHISISKRVRVIWPSKTDYLAAICSFRKQILCRSDYKAVEKSVYKFMAQEQVQRLGWLVSRSAASLVGRSGLFSKRHTKFICAMHAAVRRLPAHTPRGQTNASSQSQQPGEKKRVVAILRSLARKIRYIHSNARAARWIYLFECERGKNSPAYCALPKITVWKQITMTNGLRARVKWIVPPTGANVRASAPKLRATLCPLWTFCVLM